MSYRCVSVITISGQRVRNIPFLLVTSSRLEQTSSFPNKYINSTIKSWNNIGITKVVSTDHETLNNSPVTKNHKVWVLHWTVPVTLMHNMDPFLSSTTKNVFEKYNKPRLSGGDCPRTIWLLWLTLKNKLIY